MSGSGREPPQEGSKPVVSDPAIQEKMRLTWELHREALYLMEGNLRRRHPEASDAEIRDRLVAWLQRSNRRSAPS